MSFCPLLFLTWNVDMIAGSLVVIGDHDASLRVLRKTGAGFLMPMELLYQSCFFGREKHTCIVFKALLFRSFLLYGAKYSPDKVWLE